ncbi:IgGFc-binding protein-like [Mytilus galloprovincialis]|uniref:IgGFc-binding protein-like n=1 Tax=Mytilus galloprovincialis TaxID=29158 RepID=UPI003F7BA797
MALSYTPARGSLIGIVSTKDNTVVNLHLRITGSLSYKAKVYTNSDILTVTLNKGMTFVVSHKSDMTGTFIKSTKPISVISGNQCAFLGYSGYNGDCSPLREQLIPIEKWGKEFIVPSLNFEKPESILRIVANESNTKVSVVSNLTSISRFIFHGDFIDIVMKTDGPLYVKSSRPILTAIFGYNAFGKGHGNSKEGFLTLVPSLTHYKEKHMIVVPYTYIEDAYLSFDIACGETWSNRTGNQRFISITTDSFVKNDILYNGSPLSHVKYITTRTVVVKNMIYSSITIPSQVGYQTLQSVSGKQMFGVIVYGACWSNLFGYGFPGGFNL